VGDKSNEVKNDYGISSVVVVGDRGVLTQKNIDEFGDIDTVTALTHSAMKKLCEEKGVQLSLFDEKSVTEVILPDEPQVRYGLCKNPLRAQKDEKTRNELIKRTECMLAEIAIPKKKTDEKTLAARAAKVFYKYKTEKYFSWSIENMKIVYSRKSAIITSEAKYDGLYVIRSNVSSDVLNINEVVETYKSLMNIEQAFRSMKTVELEIRPIYHRTDERIKAHVFLCMLSYYLLWHLNKELAPFYANNPNYTRSHVIEIMKSLQKCRLTVAGISAETIAEPTENQLNILKLVTANTK
jgi:transposase